MSLLVGRIQRVSNTFLGKVCSFMRMLHVLVFERQ